MQCFNPLSLPRPKGLGSIDRVVVPCGKCVACISNNRQMWSFRLEQQLKACKTAFFITLTYDDKSNVTKVNKRDVQLFLKRLRQDLDRNTVYTQPNINGLNSPPKPKIKYYITAEYGTKTNRPHYHGIIFDIPFDTFKTTEIINKNWGNGFVYIGSVTPASINYVTKYLITKNDEKKKEVFNLISIGMGKSYIEKMGHYHKKNVVYHATQVGGKKVGLPRYYRERIFNAVEQIGYSNTMQTQADKRYNEEFTRLSELGNSPFIYEQQVKENYKRKLKDSITKNEKL